MIIEFKTGNVLDGGDLYEWSTHFSLLRLNVESRVTFVQLGTLHYAGNVLEFTGTIDGKRVFGIFEDA